MQVRASVVGCRAGRLIVQKSSPQHAKYLGVRHGLTSLFREEGLAGWYRGLSATLLHAALVPFCQAIKPVLLVTVAGLRIVVV